MDASHVELRVLSSPREIDACIALQREVWGAEFAEVVPRTILMISQRIGGVLAGAFGPGDELVGFVFGLTGVGKDGRLVHWSDMAAVREPYRDRGIGRRLKEFQRALLEPLGVTRVLWTFDPLVARNAHLNLNRLGARVVEYVPDMYADTGSPLHRGLGTDRFLVEWEIGPGASGPAPLPPASDAPIVNRRPDAAGDAELAVDLPPDAPLVRVEIPDDIRAVQLSSPDTAAKWRASTRPAFLTLLQRGYRVAGFTRDADAQRCFYVLEKQ